MDTMHIDNKPSTFDKGTQTEAPEDEESEHRRHENGPAELGIVFIICKLMCVDDVRKRKREIIELDSDSEEESDGLDDVDKEL